MLEPEEPSSRPCVALLPQNFTSGPSDLENGLKTSRRSVSPVPGLSRATAAPKAFIQTGDVAKAARLLLKG